jgi:hypothetical protein
MAVKKTPGATPLDPKGPNKSEPVPHKPFPDQKNYPEKPGRKPQHK